MTDEELIETLWSGEVTLGVVASAAVRIGELVKEVDRRIEPEQVEGLIKLAEPIMAELYGVECSYREAAEAKLAKAIDIIKQIIATAHADDYVAWDSALDDGIDFIATLEKNE